MEMLVEDCDFCAFGLVLFLEALGVLVEKGNPGLKVIVRHFIMIDL